MFIDTVTEPTLQELLDEPIIRLVMTADHVRADELRQLFDDLKPRIRWQEEALAA
jgi:hypothetical protein